MILQKTFLFLIASLLVHVSSAATDAFVFRQERPSGITHDEFRLTIARAHRLFSPLAAQDGRELKFLTDWKNEWAQSFARRWETDQVVIYGGIARIPNSTVDSFTLLICHELGHLYGGVPYRDEYNRISVEGQADWWATTTCWETLANASPHQEGSLFERGLKASLVLTSFYAANRNIPSPRIDTPDPTEVEKTLMTHPEPQCRLDTYLAGLLKNERPRCWWAR